MKSYDTLSEAIEALKKEGFTYDFNLDKHNLTCKELGRSFIPEDFNVVQVFRFEGDSNPDDNSILYAIKTSEGLKGQLLDAYGVYSGEISEELLKALNRKPLAD